MSALIADLSPLPDELSGRRRRRMLSFNAAVRPRIEGLSAGSRSLEDLADSFPALLFALSTGFGTPAARRQAVQLVVGGAPLREAAETLGLAWWTRRLPAQAFVEPILPLPDDADFRERIVSFLPASHEQARNWLWTVSYAANACHPAFALWAAGWAARQRRTFDVVIGKEHFRYLTAWAWHSGQPASPGFGLLRRPWSAQTGLRRAVDELNVWRRRHRLALCLGDGHADPWIEDGAALGFDFVALRTPGDFIAESEVMDNCLDQFADRLESGRSRVFSIRKDGRSVADVEIGTDELEAGMPAIRQLRGPRNRRAGPEIWRATYAWLGAQPLRPLSLCPPERTTAAVRRYVRAFWKPYLTAIAPATAAEFADMLSADVGFQIAAKTRERRAATSDDGLPQRRRPRAIAES